MDAKRIVVVGGVAGGMSFATRYRRLNQKDEIIVLDKGPYVSFANCGLPYYISGEIEDRNALLVAKKEMLQARFQLDVRENHEVIALNAKEKYIIAKSMGEDHRIDYDTLVLSPGAHPFLLNIEGMDQRKGIFTVRNIPDVDGITQYIEDTNPKSAVVIGAGFIGLEMAESLKQRGLDVSIVEKAPHVLPPFDVEMAAYASSELKRHGVHVYTNTSITKFEGHQGILEDGTSIDADLVIMSVGVIPATDIAKEAGIELGMRGGILVDENYQTSEEDIYAVGDAIIVKHNITKEDAMIALASPANRQGRQLADILNGLGSKNKGSLGTAIVRIFDLTFASTGLNERQLENRDYHVLHLNGRDHAGYFPNATPIRLKVIFDKKTHEILGAQAFGEKGVDKRIDIIATAIKAGLSVVDLQELEFTYAPPYGSAKDVVNMAGYVAQNLIEGQTQTVQWHEVKDLMDAGVLFVDVRNNLSENAPSLPGSIRMPLDSIRCNMYKLPQDKDIVVFCDSGQTSYNAEVILREAGFKVRNFNGSHMLYSKLVEEGVL